jgi:predicted RNase H-like HicB family nuclease
MKKMIKVEIYHDGDFYCARCLDFDIFSQGETLDELVRNIKESIVLYFEDEPLELEGYDRNPSLFSMMDLGEVHV